MFISRNGGGLINCSWTVRQFPGQEEIADNAQELLVFLKQDGASLAAQAANDARLAAIDSNMSGFSFGGQTLAQLKAMDNAAFDSWWSANVTTLAQANTVLKMIARAMLRRVL